MPSAAVPGVETFLKFRIADREVTYIQDLITNVLEIEQDERSNLWFLLHDGCIRVDEQRAGQMDIPRTQLFQPSGATPSTERTFRRSAFS